MMSISTLQGALVAGNYKLIFTNCSFTNDDFSLKFASSISNCAALCSLTFGRTAFIWRENTEDQCGLLTNCPYDCGSSGEEQGNWSLFCKYGIVFLFQTYSSL